MGTAQLWTSPGRLNFMSSNNRYFIQRVQSIKNFNVAKIVKPLPSPRKRIVSLSYNTRKWFVEEECLQTLAEDRKWRGWLDIHGPPAVCSRVWPRRQRTTIGCWQTESVAATFRANRMLFASSCTPECVKRSRSRLGLKINSRSRSATSRLHRWMNMIKLWDIFHSNESKWTTWTSADVENRRQI